MHAQSDPNSSSTGIPAASLSDADLFREIEHLHTTRSGTLRHGSDDALEHSTTRIQELEREYLARHPEREIDPERTRAGARARADA